MNDEMVKGYAIRWIDYRTQMIARNAAGKLMMSTFTSFRSPDLSDADFQSLSDYFARYKKNYIFA